MVVMERTTSGPLKEMDDYHDTSAPPFDNEEGLHDQLPISSENGFASLAVGDSVEVKAELKYTGEGIELKEDGKYCLNFRGSWFRWWRFGSLKVCFLMIRKWRAGS